MAQRTRSEPVTGRGRRGAGLHFLRKTLPLLSGESCGSVLPSPAVGEPQGLLSVGHLLDPPVSIHTCCSDCHCQRRPPRAIRCWGTECTGQGGHGVCRMRSTWAPLSCKGGPACTNLHLPANPVGPTDFRAGALAACSVSISLGSLSHPHPVEGTPIRVAQGGGVALSRAGACFSCPCARLGDGAPGAQLWPLLAWASLCSLPAPLAPWLISGGRGKPRHGHPGTGDMLGQSSPYTQHTDQGLALPTEEGEPSGARDELGKEGRAADGAILRQDHFV